MKKLIWWAAAVIVAVRIFQFSADTSEVSDKTSLNVSEKIVNTVPSTKNLPQEKKDKIAVDINSKVRKSAHYFIYIALGFTAAGAFCASFDKRKLYLLLAALILCMLYAGSDEIHQIFVAGRGCEFRDFLIDSGGSATGILLYSLISKAAKCLFC